MSSDSSQRTSWHDGAFFGIHYDLHAGPRDAAFGAEMTPENLREQWQKVRPDWVQCDCKGHPGWTSYPTQVGSTVPNLAQDTLRIQRDVTNDLGIQLVMHYSGVIDRRALDEHPDWAQIDADGQPNQRSTCRLSPYLDELMIPQLKEIIANYDVDGFWVDGDNWAVGLCYCDRCKAEFARRTGITDPPPRERGEPHFPQWHAFHRDLFREYVTRYSDAIHAAKDSCCSCSNWMYTLRQPEPMNAPIDYISGDYVANWGLYRAALECRFISQRGVSWDLMCWGFTKDYVNPYRSIWKTAEHLKQEVSEVLAQGGGVLIYGKPQRKGWLVGWHHDIIAEVADFCRARKPWCFRSESASDAAVLHLASHYYEHNAPCFNYGNAIEPVEGALHLLLETGHSTDVLNEEMALAKLSAYRLVVVPEQTRLSTPLLSALRQFAEDGGVVWMSGHHLPGEPGAAELLGIADAGEDLRCRSLDSGNSMNFELSDGSAAAALGPWRCVTLTSAAVHTRASLEMDPQAARSDAAAITVRQLGRGKVLGTFGSLFRSYFQNHEPRLRRFVRDLLDGLNLDWTAELEGPAGAPLQMTLRRQQGDLVVNLINYGTQDMTYPQRTVVERVPPVHDITLRVRCGDAPARVTLQPSGTPLQFAFDAQTGVATVRVPSVHIHDLVVITPSR